MRQNLTNIALFVVLAVGFSALWWYADKNWFPKRERPKPTDSAATDTAGKPEPNTVGAAAGGAVVAARELPAKPIDFKPPPPAPPTPRVPPTLVALGGADYYNAVLLSTRGGGIQQVVLTRFKEANRLGLEEKLPDGAGAPLYLIPGVTRYIPTLKRDQTPSLKLNPPIPEIGPGPAMDPRGDDTPPSKQLVEASYVLFHYASPDDKYPVPDLGEREWKVAADQKAEDGTHTVAFETELAEPYFLRIRKTFTLAPKEYHVGLRLDFERLPGGDGKPGPKFRYQIVGPRGLPVEGEWYTSAYRTALVGWTDYKQVPRRSYEDAATVTNRRGGEVIARADNRFKYAAIETQFFASALAVDAQAEGAAADPWAYVRATSELDITPHPDDLKKLEEAYKEEAKKPAEERNPGVVGAYQNYLKQLDRKTPHLDDITVRAVSEPLELAPGQKASHAYIVYNGPAKVRLLKLLSEEDRQVAPELVDRYLDQFGLRTLTDYQSPTFLGTFANYIYWSDIVIGMTNVMHGALWGIHWLCGSWGVSILLLTVAVRLLLFIPSRKQTHMNMKMVEVQKKLKPELDKLKEKYGDDFHRFNQEKTRLMMQHGVNPFAAMGGCLLLFAQMPIFMGLYFCLQESVFFRLEPFLWMPNLAAPDMLVWWSENIPLISSPDSMGSMLYLGPYLNALPILAVALMIWQQNKMMPPPTDDQMAAQQRVMKIMMVVVAVMFYKVAAGLSLYFIVSSLWGIIERQFIPKPDDKPVEGGDKPGGGGGGGKPAEPSPKGGDTKPAGVMGRFRARLQEKMEELQRQAEEQSARQIRNPRDRDGDRKKRRRK